MKNCISADKFAKMSSALHVTFNRNVSRSIIREEDRKMSNLVSTKKFELSEADLRAIESSTTTVSATKLVGGRGGFAIRNHSFSSTS